MTKTWNPLLAIYLDEELHIDPFTSLAFRLKTRKMFNREPQFDAERVAAYVDKEERMRKVRRLYSYAVPTDEFAHKIKEICGDKIIEMGAGTGYWAKFLSQFEIDVIAYDTKAQRAVYCDDKYYYDINEGGPEVVKKYYDRALLLSWPPYDDSYAADCLTNFQGNYVIYTGEGYGGCTGDDEFHQILEDEWEVVYSNHETINWWFVHSHDVIYKRKQIIHHEEEIY